MGKKPKNIAGRLCSIFLVLCFVMLTGCEREEAMSDAASGYVHFSIDDATQIFQEITLKEYDSIFEQPILEQLRKYHNSYGLKCTLYLYENVGDYNISQMPDTYKTEFQENVDWLKLSYHGYNENNPEEMGLTHKQFTESYIRVCEEIKRFAGEESLTGTLRLHYWYATEEMIDFLEQSGVQAILCPDSQAIGYDLTEEENNILNESVAGLYKGDILYYKTDLRYENIENVKKSFSNRREDPIIVVFTHAWCFEENASKIEDSMKWLTDNGYQFTFLEQQEGL